MKDGIESLELDKILAAASAYAVLDEGKAAVRSLRPTQDGEEARARLIRTEEATELLFTLGAGRVPYFPPLGDCLDRAGKGATLTCLELLSVATLLRSARTVNRSVLTLGNGNIVQIRELADRLVFDRGLEEDIEKKILGDDMLDDHASEKLFSIRREIKLLNERIRARLLEYLSGDERKYLQDAVITLRGDRYVLPVKAEYKRTVRGFVHDRSQSGQTVFIEPEEVLEMNNELRTLRLDELQEIERILSELSARVGKDADALQRDTELLTEIDSFYARAEYGYRLHCVKPRLNERGVVKIVKGRHPLLDAKTAVPVSVSVGDGYSFLLISGANTGGKTVTLKMCGLFCLMAACGLFVPAAEGTELAVFGGVFCDVGDSQSIEENLSTFSSHVLNLKDILERADGRSFVLIDEPGGGTDPEEGQALARAVLEDLMAKGAKGIVTTHYSALKEFAFQTDGIENGCMEFDAKSLRPLYRLKIGFPGSSNALFICSRLGLPERVIDSARKNLSEGALAFEHTVRAAEESRVQAERVREEANQVKAQWQEKLTALEREEAQFKKERERFLLTSKAEARRIVLARTAQAEEIVEKIEKLFEKETLTERDLIQARTLKNQLPLAFDDEEEQKVRLSPVDPQTLKAGDNVFVKSMNTEGEVLSYQKGKNTVELQCGALRVRGKIDDLYRLEGRREEPKKKGVEVVRNLAERNGGSRECNLIGMNTLEALEELENFLDAALLNNYDEVRIVHGMGTGKLRSAVQSYLKKHRRVKDFRLGKYGEGESGVTIVKLQ